MIKKKMFELLMYYDVCVSSVGQERTISIMIMAEWKKNEDGLSSEKKSFNGLGWFDGGWVEWWG
mgnify:CR=1 FL=1